MLVIHWARQNHTGSILANGIRPSSRRIYRQRGIWVFPYSTNRTLRGNWRRMLKILDGKLGNYNGFVFRLEPEDFPVTAGFWDDRWEAGKYASAEALSKACRECFTGRPQSDDQFRNFEIVLFKRVRPERIIKILKDRDPKRTRDQD
jgi:hypothetical protein